MQHIMGVAAVVSFVVSLFHHLFRQDKRYGRD